MTALRKFQPAPPSVQEKLVDGDYDEMLVAFQREMAAARAVLRECQELMRAANGPRH